jgi:hypothetical protein
MCVGLAAPEMRTLVTLEGEPPAQMLEDIRTKEKTT